MKKYKFLWILLVVALLLAGCDREAPGGTLKPLESTAWEGITYEEMVYTRPDMEEIEKSLDAVGQAVEGENGRRDLEEVLDRVWDFYDLYDMFYTCYSLADLRYSHDLTDSYWEEEYNYCAENSARLEAALDRMYRILAASPIRKGLEDKYFGEGFFDAYSGESGWDETYLALAEEESRLQNEFYALTGMETDAEYASTEYFDECAPELMEVLVELIRVRQQMAAHWGYDDYVAFATDASYYRDYTPAQSERLLADIARELVPMYRELNGSGFWDTGFREAGEAETWAYVRDMAHAMGGKVEEAFRCMEGGGLHDIGFGENKYTVSYEVYLTSYQVPFVFMNPEGSTYDFLTFTHEFGHFCNDYASDGSYAGVDVLEFFSQGLEYLSLCYGGDELSRVKLADSLCLYVEQAAYAAFETEMYALRDEELTAENLMALYDEIALRYGFESVGYDPREFVTVNHYYTNPMYIISYVVSNDAALQLYQMERQQPGTGLKCYEKNLNTQEVWFLEFLDDAGLESPFATGRMTRVRELFEAELG